MDVAQPMKDAKQGFTTGNARQQEIDHAEITRVLLDPGNPSFPTGAGAGRTRVTLVIAALTAGTSRRSC